MAWQNYESTVKYIYEALGARVGVAIECHGIACRRLGKSGVPHQIDDLTSHSDGIHKYYTAIECKFWNQKLNKDIVIKTAYVNDDCNLDKSVLETKECFTDDAIQTARNTNVFLVELKEHNLAISADTLTKFYMNSGLSIPELNGTIINIHEKYKGKYENHLMLKRSPYDIFIEKKNKEIIALKDLINEFRKCYVTCCPNYQS